MRHHLLGCVDGIRGNELQGWILNKGYPEYPELITCHGGSGETRVFYPFTFREDVVRATRIDGVFGFAIPLDLLAPLGPCCSITNRFGDVLDRGDAIELPKTSVPSTSKSLVHIFLHIPKTAGTSLRNTLLRTIPASKTMLLYPNGTVGMPADKFLSVPLYQRNSLQWVFGHIKFGLDRYITKSSRYITFIREPMARLRSNAHHHAVLSPVLKIGNTRLPLPTVINEGLSEDFDNPMTRALAGIGTDTIPLGQIGQDEVEIALYNVRRHFCFVGNQSTSDRDSRILQEYLGLPSSELSQDNVTPELNQDEMHELSKVDWNKVLTRNRPDVLLYDRLEREGLVSTIIDHPRVKESG